MPAARLLARIHNYLPEDRALLVKDALEFAAAAHQGQYRESEEPYIEHPIATAEFLAEREMDATTLSAALLHDVIEDCDVTREELEERFGEDVARLVDGVTKMKRIDTMSGGNEAGANNLASAPPGDDRAARQAASMRKMLV
ncbi:MAG: HD domain-containing protein, partial [Chloroflexota bacterium]